MHAHVDQAEQGILKVDIVVQAFAPGRPQFDSPSLAVAVDVIRLTDLDGAEDRNHAVTAETALAQQFLNEFLFVRVRAGEKLNRTVGTPGDGLHPGPKACGGLLAKVAKFLEQHVQIGQDGEHAAAVGQLAKRPAKANPIESALNPKTSSA